MLLPGEEELADELLGLVETARKQEATIPEQGKVLHQMGELYLRDAIETGNREQYVKASALVNGALVRSDNKSEQKILRELLCNIYQKFLENVQMTSSTLLEDDLMESTKNNKANLHAIRKEVKKMCRNIEQFVNTYSLADIYETERTENDRVEMEEQLVAEVKKVSLEIQTRLLKFVKDLWKQAAEMCPVLPPCRYSVIGLGSIARQEMTPYSDLEFAMLVETNSDEIKQYFKNLVNLFHLLVLDLGETPIPEIGIESLNDYQSPGGDKFFDRITPRGFRLDGAMPWACKTPIGRGETPQRAPLDLIKTPKEMAELQREENILGQAYHVAGILCNHILICGDSALYKKYRSLYVKTVSKVDHKKIANKTLADDYSRFQTTEFNSSHFYTQVLKNKTSLYRFPSTFVENLRMYFSPFYQPNSSWKVLDHLLAANILSCEGAFNLKVHLAICLGVRILAYFQNNGQYENIGLMATKESNAFKEGAQNQRMASYAAFFKNDEPFNRLSAGNNALSSVVKKYFINGDRTRINDLKRETLILFDTEIDLQPNLDTWFRNRPILTNLKWARTSGELPSKVCGIECCEIYLGRLSHIFTEQYMFTCILLGIDKMLSLRYCKCVPLIRTSLLVSKAILIKAHSQIGKVPKVANIFTLQENYRQKKYNSLRERIYLLIDVSDLASITMDLQKNIMLSVIKDITEFLDEIDTFEDSQKEMIQMTKSYLIERLMSLYEKAGKLDKAILLCEKQIEECEKDFGHENQCLIMSKWYSNLGCLKENQGLLSDAMLCLQKAFDSTLFGYENETRNVAAKCFLRNLQFIAMRKASLHLDKGNKEDAIEVLTTAFIGKGEDFPMETDLQICGVTLLMQYCYETEKYRSKANQYAEKVLEIILEKDKIHQLQIGTKLEVAKMVIWLFWVKATQSSPIIENVFRKHCQSKGSKADFLEEVLYKLFDDETLYCYFLLNIQDINEVKHQTPCHCTWFGYFLTLCFFSLKCAFAVDPFLVATCRASIAMIQLAEIFCNKVVKKCASTSIYQLCWVFLQFNRLRLWALIASKRNKWNFLQRALIAALEIQRDINFLFRINDFHFLDNADWFNRRFRDVDDIDTHTMTYMTHLALTV